MLFFQTQVEKQSSAITTLQIIHEQITALKCQDFGQKNRIFFKHLLSNWSYFFF